MSLKALRGQITNTLKQWWSQQMSNYNNAAANTLRTISRTAVAHIKVGDKLPSVELYEEVPANRINIANLVANKKVCIFGVPGAFTPGCSRAHLPGFVHDADMLKTKHAIDEIVCIAMNDPFVMSAWGKEQKCTGRVRMLADPAGTFTRALNMSMELPSLGGTRTKRFSMVVENGEVKELNVEPDGLGLTVSMSHNIGKSLNAAAAAGAAAGAQQQQPNDQSTPPPAPPEENVLGGGSAAAGSGAGAGAGDQGKTAGTNAATTTLGAEKADGTGNTATPGGGSTTTTTTNQKMPTPSNANVSPDKKATPTTAPLSTPTPTNDAEDKTSKMKTLEQKDASKD